MKPTPAFFVTLLVLASTTAALAASPGRLDRIREVKTIVISHGEAAIPFSYIAQSGPVGFGAEVSLRIADAIKAHLNLDTLKVRWNPVTLSTRFPMIVTDTVDLECITTTNTRARQDMVGFSNTYYISDEGIVARRDSGIRTSADLAGKRVAAVRGTTTEKGLQSRGLTVVSERNNRMAMSALKDGRADAYVAASAIAAGELLRLEDAKPFQIIATGEHKEAFGCMLPKGDVAYKKVVDDALGAMMKSGEMEKIYNKWFTMAIPPYGRNLNMPLNEDNRKLYQSPNDTAYE
jgi:glutamate/aspartate transport system substrate-binding protein